MTSPLDNDNPFLNPPQRPAPVRDIPVQSPQPSADMQTMRTSPASRNPAVQDNTSSDESIYDRRDAQSIDPINFSQMQHMRTNDVNDVNDDDDKWNALMRNDPDVYDAETAGKVFKRRRMNSQLRIIFTGLVIIILLAVITGSVLYFAKVFKNETAQDPTRTSQQTPSEREGKYQDTNNGHNPASASDVSYVAPSTNTNVTTDAKNVKLDSETTSSVIEIPSLSEPIGKEADCMLANTASTCYIGTVKAGEGKTADLFAFRDAAQSSLLMTDTESTDFTVQGASIAYRTKVQADGKQYEAAVMVAKDQSGIMMVGEPDAINAITGGNQIRIASTSKK